MSRTASAPIFALAAAFLAAGLSGCGSAKSAYPALRDIPPPPKELTPEAVRESLKADLSKDREGAGEGVGSQVPAKRREPAVPPKGPQGQSAHEGETGGLRGAECAPPGDGAQMGPTRIVQAIPPLRGTVRTPERLVPEGVTAATKLPQSGVLRVRFEPATADLSSAVLEELRLRSAMFLERGGGDILIDVRGAPPQTPNTVHSLERLQLGLRRASFIADYLIAQGVSSDRIKLLVTDADGATPAGAMIDGAQVTFVAGKRASP